MRSAAPGRKFCTNTSARAASRCSTARPASVFRSSTTERLLRFVVAKSGDILRPALPVLRVRSPVARLDLDHVRALVAEDPRRDGAGDHLRDVEDAVAVEWAGHGGF